MKVTFKILFVFFFLFFQGCASSVYYTRSRLLMGHVPVNVTLKISNSKEQKEQAWEETERAYQVAIELEKKFSEYKSESDISCLNRFAGKRSCVVSSETYTLLKESIMMGEKTDQAFNIRFRSVSKKGTEASILFMTENKVFLSDPDTRLGVSGSAKGFILDRMIESFQAHGIKEVLIDAGGDVRALGGPWKVGIQTPFSPPGKIAHVLKIKDAGLASSGTDENRDNIVDPVQRKFVRRKSTVTVLGKNLTTANMASTALYVLGEGKTEEMLKKIATLQEVFWTDETGKVRSYKQKIPVE